MEHIYQFDGHKILLAPSVMPVAERLRNYFEQQPGTKINSDGGMIAQRSDGTHTHIGPDFWTQLNRLIPLELYSSVSSDLHILQATQDEIIENKPELVKQLNQVLFSEIDGNHNFEGASRAKLLQYIRDIFYGE